MAISRLWAYGNNIKGVVDFNNNRLLEEINIGFNEITGINKCIYMRKLLCYDNKLTKLNLSNFTNLEILNCNSNQLTELNLTGCINLKELECFKIRT